MIAIEEQDHFVVDQFGNAAGILPVNAQPDITLPKLIEVIVDNNVSAALQTIFNKFFDTGQFLFGHLSHIFAKGQSILAEISIKILCL